MNFSKKYSKVDFGSSEPVDAKVEILTKRFRNPSKFMFGLANEMS